MSKDFIKHYYLFNGSKKTRKLFHRITMIPFAGSKYLFDRILALLGLIILSPLILIISILIKLDSTGPILFKQIRTGKKGKEFYVYKFRTMVVNNDVYDLSKEDEHTRLGTFLRKTSLDEIPQLISILKGDMSFIGPRPWIPDYYKFMNKTERHRCDVRPGLTGLAQVKGRNNITIFEKITYDLEYIKNYSLQQDIKIIFLTIITVLKKCGCDAGKNTINNEIEDLKKENTIHEELKAN